MTTTLSPSLNIATLNAMPENVGERFRSGIVTPTSPTRIHSNLLETWSAFYLQIVVPGIDVSTLKIESAARKVVVQGEYRIAPVEAAHFLRHDLPTGVMHDSFDLPDDVDGSGAEASYKAGVLTVRVPKMAHLRPASIPIHMD
jgi:HSP20 family protein